MYDSNPFRLPSGENSDMVTRVRFGGRTLNRIVGRQRNYRFSPNWRLFAAAEHGRSKRDFDELEWLTERRSPAASLTARRSVTRSAR